jgi:transposase-like protein
VAYRACHWLRSSVGRNRIDHWQVNVAPAVMKTSQSNPMNPVELLGLSMIKSDVTCPKCRAGYRRIELVSKPGDKGEFRCLVCDHLLEVFDGKSDVALRLTVASMKVSNNGDKAFLS